MERLPLHIEYLLTRHDCVIVPGLGAFIATETETHIDRDRGIVTPRRRDISFNGSVVTDDGLLSHSLARREGLPYEDAHRLLESLISHMRRELQMEGETSVGRIGKLARTEEGSLGFIPRRSITDSDIMTEIPISVQTSATTAGDEAGSDNTNSTLRKSIAANDPARRRIVIDRPDRYVFSISKRLVHAAAAIALLLTVCLSILIPYNHDEEQRASVVPIEDFLRRPLVIEVAGEDLEEESEVAVEVIEEDTEGAADSIINANEIKNR